MQETQKFMGRNQLIDRLSAQVGSRDSAIKILQQRGHLKPDGKTFTALGAARNAMTAAERAKDRAATKLGKDPSQFIYNPKTNIAQLKRR
jgi:hypothetical protein